MTLRVVSRRTLVIVGGLPPLLEVVHLEDQSEADDDSEDGRHADDRPRQEESHPHTLVVM